MGRRRLSRILLNAGAVVSLGLFLASVAAWIDSALRPEWSPRSFGSYSTVRFTLNRVALYAHIGPYNTGGGMTWHAPYWKLLLITGWAPAAWLRHRHRRRQNARRGLCPVCGYDLRATPDRCPECGTAAAGATGQESRAS
jgi:hypothetical protein